MKEGKIPIIPFLGAPGIKLSNSTLKQNLTRDDIQLKTLDLIIEKFYPDGIFPFMDLTIEAEALGLSLDFPENDYPHLKEPRIKTLEDLEFIKRKYKGLAGRMPLFLTVVENLAKKYSIVIGAYVIGPFSLSGELIGIENLFLNLKLKPAFVHKFLDFAFRVIKDYADALFNAGAQMVAILEPSAVLLSPKQFTEFSGDYISRLVEELGKKLILHICGNSTHLLQEMSRTGVMGLSVDSPVNLKNALEVVSENIVVMGNIDPITVFLQSTPEEVARATRALLEEMRGTKNFILSSGCDIPVATPLENIEAFMNEARKSNLIL